MSLEQAIQENTNAIHQLIAALGNGITTSQIATATDTIAAAKPAKAEAKQPETKAAPAEKKQWYYHPESESYAILTETEAADSPEADLLVLIGNDEAKARHEAERTTVDQPAVTFDDVKKATLELSKVKGRDAAIKVLNSYGAAKAPDLKEEQWPQYVISCKAAMEA